MLVYLVCSGVLVVLYFVLAANVSRMRRKTETGIGGGADPSGPLNKAVRAHGNAAEYAPIFVRQASAAAPIRPDRAIRPSACGNVAEYAPIFVALFLYFSLSAPSGWIPWVVVIVTVSRILHAAGMLMTKTFNAPPHPLRAIGSAGTYIGGLALGETFSAPPHPLRAIGSVGTYIGGLALGVVLRPANRRRPLSSR